MNQLALPLRLQDYAVFESFWPAGNEAIVEFLQELAVTRRGPGAWLSGGEACGKSHLLQAFAARCGDDAVYLPLALLRDTGPAVIDGLTTRQVVCLDDLQAVAGEQDWELALFQLVNELNDHGGILLVASIAPPRDSSIGLPDLASRFARLPVFQVTGLDEPGRIHALQLRAELRGLSLPDKTARYLLSRNRRDMGSLYELLDRLDAEALKAQRKLTIPFVRDVLGAR